MKDKLINKLLQYVSDLHLEKGFKRNIIPKKPNLILGGDIGYVFKKSYEEFLLYKISPNFEKVFILSGNHEYDTFKNKDIKVFTPHCVVSKYSYIFDISIIL